MPALEAVEIKVDFSEVRGRLAVLPPRLGRNVVRRGLYAAAKVLEQEARRTVPVRFGLLKKTIRAETRRVRAKKGAKDLTFRAAVTIKKDAFKLTKKGKYRKAGRQTNLLGKRVRYKKGDVYPRNYAHLVEFGTRPHSVGRGSELEVSKRVLGKRVVFGRGHQRGAQHPGAKPRPFLGPAASARHGEALATFERTLREGIAKELRNMSATTRAAG